MYIDVHIYLQCVFESSNGTNPSDLLIVSEKKKFNYYFVIFFSQ